MAKKHAEGYLSAKESRRIAKENRKITNELEKCASARMCLSPSTDPDARSQQRGGV